MNMICLKTITSTNTNGVMLDTHVTCFKTVPQQHQYLYIGNSFAHQGNTPMLLKTPLSSTCSVCYPCLRPVRPPGTTPRAGRPPPSLLHGFHGNALQRPPCLPPLVTLATQVTAPAHKTGATDAPALDITTLRNRAVRAAATGLTLLTLSIPPAVRLDQSQRRVVEGVQTGDQ